MGDHSDVPPWTRRILPLNFYTKFFRADVFYRIMTEREKERKDQMEEEKNEEREGGRKEKERESAQSVDMDVKTDIFLLWKYARARE